MDRDQILDFFYNRRSIREFKQGAKISDYQMETILKAAMSAPSANNQQPWHFIVVDDRQKMREITRHHPYSSALNSASACIIVLGDTSTDRKRAYWTQDCSAATENMLLAIANLGLGGVWLGVHPRKEREDAIREIFGVPEYITPLCVVAIGVPDEDRGRTDRFEVSKIHKNFWGNRD